MHVRLSSCRICARSRPGKKNDNCYVEQKNFDLVRKLVGYARYSSDAMLDTLNELYAAHGLLANYFYPTQRCIEKKRVGSRVFKRHDKPKTPADRLLARSDVSPACKSRLRRIRSSLDPFALAAKVDVLSRRLHDLLKRDIEAKTG